MSNETPNSGSFSGSFSGTSTRQLVITAIAVTSFAATAGFWFARVSGSPGGSANAKSAPNSATSSAATGAPAGAPAGGPPPPSITAANAQNGDIDVTISALGVVTPLHTVTITPRVQGEIVKVQYTEGQMVKKGDSLIIIDPRPYKAILVQAQGTLAKDMATLKEDKIDLQRYQSAYESQAISKQQVDDQLQVVKQLEGAVLADQGTVDSAQANLDYCYIKAPITGRVGLRLVDEGNMVQSNSTTALVVITQLQPISVVFTLAEDDISKVQTQISAQTAMNVDAYDRSQTKKIGEGTFGSLDNQVDATTGTVKAKAEYVNDDLHLFPNEFVNIKMRVKTEHGLLRVPSIAIQKGSQGPFVYVVSEDNTIHVQPVEPGLSDETYTSVTGLKEGDRVATSNFDKLQEKAHVQIRQDDPNNGKSVAKEDVK